VRLVIGDTDRVAIGTGSHSGRSLRLASITAHQAAEEIIERGRRIASHRLEAAEADIDFADRHFTVAGTDRSLDLFAVAAAAQEDASLPEELRGALAGVGEVDVGRAVNPMILHGQTHGGIAQGAGQALFEQCVYGAESGQLRSGSFMDYAMPRAADLPFFATAISEVPSTTHPLGFRGGGEGGITPALGIIVNAIVDALGDLGVTHLEMPVTPERVWRATRRQV
jgi:carbon-monoxide dehydrogenase large subunit